MNMMATRAGAAAVKSVRPHSRRRVKNFPAKDALADKIESYSIQRESVERGRQKKRKANAAKFLQRLIFCSGRSRSVGLVLRARARVYLDTY